MQKKILIKHLKKNGAILAKNMRPIYSIWGMSEYVRLRKPEKYILFGYIFGRPILCRKRKV